jgi:hypothetical protein
LYVVAREMGGMTAPVSSFASEPAWITRVLKWYVSCWGSGAGAALPFESPFV